MTTLRNWNWLYWVAGFIAGALGVLGVAYEIYRDGRVWGWW